MILAEAAQVTSVACGVACAARFLALYQNQQAGMNSLK
jgi:hypothetical protein